MNKLLSRSQGLEGAQARERLEIKALLTSQYTHPWLRTSQGRRNWQFHPEFLESTVHLGEIFKIVNSHPNNEIFKNCANYCEKKNKVL